MIRSNRRAADAEDLKAMTQGKGSPVRNILTVTLPIGVLLWLGMYWLARSVWPALVVAGAFVLALSGRTHDSSGRSERERDREPIVRPWK
jgi:Flp pilus assembly protein TadB